MEEETTKIELGAQDEEDWISRLVDDLIFHEILRRLDMKSAAQTSILSKRWRYVWSNWSDLDFHPLEVIPEYNMWGDGPSEIMTASYLNWVDQVLNAHLGPSIDHFRIFFPFGANHSSRIDTWVKFAVSKRVKKLELDLFSDWEFFPHYKLELDLLYDSGGTCFLTSLHLTRVDVSGELLEFILLQCPLLEQLYVFHSEDLVSLKVVDLSCKFKLKHLSVGYCGNLERVEIFAGSLEYFEFYGTLDPYTVVEFKNAPSLVEATFGGICFFTPNPLFMNIACISKQLSTLTLSLQAFDFLEGDLLNIPRFCNVKHLKLRVLVDPDSFLLRLAWFVEACPVLSELKLEVFWLLDGEEDAKASDLLDVDGKDLLLHPPTYMKTYPSLRVLEVVGFLGCDADVQLLLFFARRAPNLKTIVCDSHCYFHSRFVVELQTMCPVIPDMKETSRRRASKLAASGLAPILPRASIIII